MGGSKSKHRDIRTDSDACPHKQEKRGCCNSLRCCTGFRGQHADVVIIEKVEADAPCHGNTSAGRQSSKTGERKNSVPKKSKFVVMPLSEFEKKCKKLPEHKKVLCRRFIDNDIYNLCLSPQEIEMCLNAFKRNADVVAGSYEDKMAKEVFMSLIGISTGTDADNETDESIMLELLWQQFDQDGDGYLDRTEFLVGFSFWKNQLNEIPPHEKAKFWFVLFDKNRDGTLDEAEFTRMIEHVLLANEGTQPQVTVGLDFDTSDMIHEWLEQAFGEADKDGDGVLSVDEFDDWLASHHKEQLEINNTSYPIEVVSAALRLSFTAEGLSKNEFNTLIQRTLAFDLKPDDKVADRAKTLARDLFTKVDTDGGGTVCYDEYSAWLNANPEYVCSFTCQVDGDDDSEVVVKRRGLFGKQLSMHESKKQLNISMRRSINDKESSMTLTSQSSGILNPLQGSRKAGGSGIKSRASSRSYVGSCRSGSGSQHEGRSMSQSSPRGGVNAGSFNTADRGLEELQRECSSSEVRSSSVCEEGGVHPFVDADAEVA